MNTLKSSTWESITPVPDHAPEPEFVHPIHGRPVAVYEYKNTEGSLFGFSVRFEKEGRKKFFMPRFFGRMGLRDGNGGDALSPSPCTTPLS